MKKMITAIIFLTFAVPASAQNVSTGMFIPDGVLKSFYLAIGDYYRVPESRVVHVKKHYRVPDEELPAVFFLAARAHVDPDVIIDLRIGQRMSWLNITATAGWGARPAGCSWPAASCAAQPRTSRCWLS